MDEPFARHDEWMTKTTNSKLPFLFGVAFPNNLVVGFPPSETNVQCSNPPARSNHGCRDADLLSIHSSKPFICVLSWQSFLMVVLALAKKATSKCRQDTSYRTTSGAQKFEKEPEPHSSCGTSELTKRKASFGRQPVRCSTLLHPLASALIP